MIFHLYRTLLILTLCVCNLVSYSQDEKVDIQALVESKTFVFSAQTASPLKAALIHLDPGYRLLIKGDTLICDLPYFGRVYQAPVGHDGGLNFKSYKYEYLTKPGKKGKWTVQLKTKDLPSQHQFYLTITPNGHGTLTVTSADRQSISYSGLVSNKTDQR